MDEVEELARLIETQIDRQAIEKLYGLYQQGALSMSDIDKFKVSVQQYKAVLLAQHDGWDESVKHELLKSLLTDYQATIDRLVNDIVNRTSPEIIPALEADGTPRRRRGFHFSKKPVTPDLAEGSSSDVSSGRIKEL